MLVVKQQRLEQRKQLFRKRLEQEHKRLFCGGKVHPTSGHRTSWRQVHIQPLGLERKLGLAHKRQVHKRLFCGGKVHPTSGHRTSWRQVHIQPLELERKRRQERHMVLHKLFQHGSQ
jgi:hypothetical protein